jgi:hypothetical protein
MIRGCGPGVNVEIERAHFAKPCRNPGRAPAVRKRLIFLMSALVSLLSGCADDSGSDSASLPDVDYAYFVARVQPVLESRCAFFACHGNRTRSFQVYAVTRMREIVDPNPIFEAPAPLTTTELERNFRHAAGMLYGFEDPEDSLLFSKPLAIGTRHGGATLFGGPNVFLSRKDPDYQTLLKWARGARLEEGE